MFDITLLAPSMLFVIASLSVVFSGSSEDPELYQSAVDNSAIEEIRHQPDNLKGFQAS